MEGAGQNDNCDCRISKYGEAHLYSALDDMPEHMRKALPDMQKMMVLLNKQED